MATHNPDEPARGGVRLPVALTLVLVVFVAALAFFLAQRIGERAALIAFAIIISMMMAFPVSLGMGAILAKAARDRRAAREQVLPPMQDPYYFGPPQPSYGQPGGPPIIVNVPAAQAQGRPEEVRRLAPRSEVSAGYSAPSQPWLEL